MDEMNERWVDDFVDAQLLYLRGEGPRPDLGELTDAERAEVLRLLDLVEALSDSAPASPPIEEDPVAIRLGILDSSRTPAVTAQEGDAVTLAVEELSYPLGDAIQVEPVTMPPLDNPDHRPMLVCRSIAEVVLVVTYGSESQPRTAADARPLFQNRPDISAVAFTSTDAEHAAVLTHSESLDRLIPLDGWRAPRALSWEPLVIALGRHFDRTMPRWDEVASLPSGDLLEDLDAEALRLVTAELGRVASTRAHLPHKKHAREFVAGLDGGVFQQWLDAVRARQASGDELVTQIRELSQAATQ